MLPAKKKDVIIRWCIDFRQVNYRVIADNFPIPRIESGGGVCDSAKGEGDGDMDELESTVMEADKSLTKGKTDSPSVGSECSSRRDALNNMIVSDLMSPIKHVRVAL